MTAPLCPFCREPAHEPRDCPALQSPEDMRAALLRARARLMDCKEYSPGWLVREIDEILAWPKKERP